MILSLVYDHRIQTCTTCSLTDCEALGKPHTWNMRALAMAFKLGSVHTCVTGCHNLGANYDMHIVVLRL